MSSFWQANWHRLHDTHCHVMDFADPLAMAQAIGKRRIPTHVMTVSADQYVEATSALGDEPYLINSLGAYPEAFLPHAWDEAAFLRHLPTAALVGEVGLDGRFDEPDQWGRQCRAFETVLGACEDAGGKIMSVHSRRADGAVAQRLVQVSRSQIILHWYSGSVDHWSSWPENVWFSINTAMLRSLKRNGMLTQLPPERCLLESDGPYIIVGDAPATPWHQAAVVERMAQLWGTSYEEALTQFECNFRQLYTFIG